MNRRRFLQLSAVSAATGLANAGHPADACAPYDLLHLLGPESVRALGRRYREIVPTVDLLAARPWLRPAANRLRDDFARGHTILIEGWVLSVTEARQCAFYSLLPS